MLFRSNVILMKCHLICQCRKSAIIRCSILQAFFVNKSNDSNFPLIRQIAFRLTKIVKMGQNTYYVSSKIRPNLKIKPSLNFENNFNISPTFKINPSLWHKSLLIWNPVTCKTFQRTMILSFFNNLYECN